MDSGNQQVPTQPVQSQPAQPVQPAPPVQSQPINAKVLLVEDDLFLRDLYVEVLKEQGFTVFTADDGEEGLRLGQDNPDASIMLLDIMLPKMHGVDVLKKLKEDTKTAAIPVVMLTNLTEQSVVQESLRLGAIGYLVKVKYTPPQVVDKVKEFLNFHKEHLQ
jgi:DNA-binding response OmpR family regulator